jgi:hypothetical protein
VAFCFADGWDFGEVKKHYASPKGKKAQYNFEVKYAGDASSRDQRLKLEDYGCEASEVTAWVLLVPVSMDGKTEEKEEKEVRTKRRRR